MQEGSPDWQPTPIDPLNYMTQAGAALKFFLQGHAKATSKIRPAITERRLRSGYSKTAILWLENIMRTEGIFIGHAGNSSKEYFDKMATQSYVDGYCCRPGQRDTVFEFLGCYWHGCPHCHPTEISTYTALHPTRNIPWKIIHEKTLEKISKLQTVYDVRTQWECEFNRTYVPTEYDIQLTNLIDHREMFCGGRTEVFSPYCKSTETDQIQYHDVTSMYPSVCAAKMMPIGHPRIFFGNSCEI